jgi:hypothetical protein
MIKKLLFTGAFLMALSQSRGQELISRILEGNDSTLAPITEDGTKKKSKWDATSIIDLSSFSGTKDHASGINNQGIGFNIGLEVYRKWCDASSLVLGAYFVNQSSQYDVGKSLFPVNNPQFHRQTLNVSALGLRLMDRIFITPSHNKIRTFFDFGGYANVFRTGSLVNEYRYNPRINGVREEIQTYRKLDYINPVEYGPMVRIGNNLLALTFSYRMSNYFKNAPNLVEIPKWMWSIQIGGNN